MATTQDILKPSDFGDFEPELEQAFSEAFRFSWDPGEASPEEQQRRRQFSPAIMAARLERDTEPAKALALMQECHELSIRLGMFLQPDELLRDELAEIMAAIAHVGGMIAG